MYQRGEVVIFRIQTDEFSRNEKARGRLTVGVIQDVKLHNHILIGNDYIEKQQELLTIRIIGLYRPIIEYPDRLHISHGCDDQSSGCPNFSHWHNLRREVLANQIEEMKVRNDCDVDFAKAWSSEVTDLDILFAKYEVDRSSLDGLSISDVQAETNVFRPSIFHSKIMTARGALRQHEVLSSLFESFKSWRVFILATMKLKLDAAMIIQKYARTYFERNTLERQRCYIKWYDIQKEYLNDYANPSDSTNYYNVRGTAIYFHTKSIADKWSKEMRMSLGVIATYAMRNIFNRRKEAMRRWKLSLFLQVKEAKDMIQEDILSSSISCER